MVFSNKVIIKRVSYKYTKKMKQLGLLLLIIAMVLLGTNATFAQNKASQFVRSAITKTQNVDCFKYNFRVYSKSIGEIKMPLPWQGEAFVSPDTFICHYTSWGGNSCDIYSLRIKDSVSRIRFYNDDNQYTSTNGNKENFAQHSGFNCYSNLAKQDKPIFYVNDSSCYFMPDTLINGMQCIRVACFENGDGVISWSQNKFYVNKKDTMLVGFENYSIFDNVDTIYKAVFLNNYELNIHFNSEKLHQKLKQYKDITKDTVLNPPFVPAKNKGDTILGFVTYGLFDSINQIHYTKGKVMLLDFWYMACYGCVMSYPVINKLHQAYASNKNVEIYSINPFDLDTKQYNKLMSYVKKYEMESTLVKMSNNEFKIFQTNVYPTFYVLVDGVVKTIKIGSYDGLYNDLKQAIDNGLNDLK